MRHFWITGSLLLCFLAGLNAWSQSSNATLSGTVQDPTNAFIPGVTITATNNATGIVSTVLTNEAGTYTFASLQPGSYDVQSDLSGFQPQVIKAFPLGGGGQARLNFTLQVGTTGTVIDVTASQDVALATSSNSVGTVLPEYQVRELPQATRNVFNLVANTAGVQSNTGGTIGFMAGGRLGSVNATRDGINVNDGRYENGAWSVTYTSADLVEEVKVVVAPVDAEASRGSGQVSMVTRSGGNAYKGSLFWVNHNSALDANDWFANRDGNIKDFDNRNQFGGRISGPIARNKTFFFFLFDGQRDLKRSQVTGSTLTDMAKAGIFRFFPGVDNGNASSTVPTVDKDGNPVQPAGATGPLQAIGLFGSCNFKGAPVANCTTFSDPSRPSISTNAFMVESLKRMPSPNQFNGGDGLNTAQILFTRRQEGLDLTNGNGDEVNRDQYNARLDHNFNSRHKLSLIGTNEKTWGTATQAGLRAWPLAYDGLAVKRPYVYTIQFTSTLSSSMLNQIRLGKKASNNWQWGSANRGDAIGAEARALVNSASGIKYQTATSLWTPFVNIGGFGRWREGINPLKSFADDLSWSTGKHGFKMGYEWRRNESNGFNDPNYDPVVTLGAGSVGVTGIDSTNFPGLRSTPAGTARTMLYELSGSVNAINQAFGVVSAKDTTLVGTPRILNNAHWNYQAEGSAYFKDDWKFRPDLTLNLGIHWEYYGQPYEHNGLAARVVGDKSALTGLTCYGTPGVAGSNAAGCDNLTTVQFVGKNSTNPSIGTNLQGNDYNNFAPAIGFSWNLPWFGKGKTVLRSGYGISYSGALRNFITVDGVIGTVPGINLVSGGSGLNYVPPAGTLLPAVTLPIPFPIGTPTSSPFPVPVTARSLGLTTYNQVSQYTQNWNMELQREVAKNTTVNLRYIGTEGIKLWGNINLNEIDALHHNKGLFDAFNAVRAGGESALLNTLLNGINFGSNGVVNGTTVTGAMAVRNNTTTRAQIANGNVGAFVNTLNTVQTGVSGGQTGAVLRKNGFPENYIVANPQYSSVNVAENPGTSTYHSLQAQVIRRLTKGFTNTTTWTWSKAMQNNNNSGRDPSNYRAETQLQAVDHTHQLTSNGTFELPFGSGHFLGGNAPGWAQQVIHGWQLSGIMNFNSGAPVNVSSGISTIGTSGAQPNLVGAFPKSTGKLEKLASTVNYFNGYTQITDPGLAGVSTLQSLSTSYSNKAIVDPQGKIVLANPQPGEIGTLGLNTIKGPSSIGLDMNMIKRFKITESKEFELRLDAVNVLNHPNFGSPSAGINGSNNFGLISSASGTRSFVVNTRLNF